MGETEDPKEEEPIELKEDVDVALVCFSRTFSGFDLTFGSGLTSGSDLRTTLIRFFDRKSPPTLFKRPAKKPAYNLGVCRSSMEISGEASVSTSP